MTDPKHLAMTNEEMNALAARWERLPEEARNSYLEQMSRAQKARFERTVERHQEGSKHFAGKLTTRQDVVAMIAMWQDRQLLPLAARLDSVERWIEFQGEAFLAALAREAGGAVGATATLARLEGRPVLPGRVKHAARELGRGGPCDRRRRGSAITSHGGTSASPHRGRLAVTLGDVLLRLLGVYLGLLALGGIWFSVTSIYIDLRAMRRKA